MGFIERAAATSLALTMLSAPALAESPESPRNEAKYQLPLAVLDEMVDVNLPQISEIYKKVSNSPARHIEIIDGFGYGEHPYIQDGFSYFIYPDDQVEEEIDPPWSIAIFVSEFEGQALEATIAVQINSELEVYNGREDIIPDFSLAEADLSAVSEDIFNEPRNLSAQEWEAVLDVDIPMIGRFYVDENGRYFEQVVRADNLIIYSSPFPVLENANSESGNDFSEPNLPAA